MANLQPVSVKQARMVASFYPSAFWSSADGGDITADEISYTDTNTNLKMTLAGVLGVGKKTLKKVHDPVVDAPLLAAITAQFKSAKPFSVTVQPVKNDVEGTALGSLTTYPNCTLLGFKPPKYDREGSGVAMIEIDVAVNSMPTFA